MTTTSRPRTVNVADPRLPRPIQAVSKATGVVPHPTGRGWLGCCPFHDDTEASLGVAGAPEWLHLLGRGASRAVIDPAGRLRQVGFPGAVDVLHGTFGRMPPTPVPPGTCNRPTAGRWSHSVPPSPENPGGARNQPTPSATSSRSLCTIGALAPVTDRVRDLRLFGSPKEIHP